MPFASMRYKLRALFTLVYTGDLHPSINLEEPEEEVDMSLIVGNEKQKLEVNVALSNSFGFGGHNSCIMFKPYRE